MFKIGEFSKLALVTVKALRFYDEAGLIKPAAIDPETGYRYYATVQLYDAHKIVSLRQAGLSVREIREIASGSDPEAVLSRRKRELEKEAEETNARLNKVTEIIKSLQEGNKMKFQATVKELPGCTVYYGVKKLAKFDDLNNFICGLGEECAKANPAVRCVSPEYCFVSYLDEEFTDHDFTALYAQAVDREGAATENVRFKKLAPVEAVCVVVKGAYENLSEGYAYAIGFAEANGFELAEKPREVYIDGVWNTADPKDYVTEIQLPVRKINRVQA